jgi:hypothetical protein
MSERQFCTSVDSSQNNFNPRLAGILLTACPTPGHDDASGWVDYEKFTAALVLSATEPAEANSITPTDTQIGFRQQNRARIRAPPMRHAFSSGDGLEDDLRRRFDATYKSETGHYLRPRASNSLRSA